MSRFVKIVSLKLTSQLIKYLMFSEYLGYITTGYAEMQLNGNFVLVNDTGSVYWNITLSSDGAFMWLQDNGNLLIRSKDGSKTLWQTNKQGSC
jgi:hypothetical protein